MINKAIFYNVVLYLETILYIFKSCKHIDFKRGHAMRVKKEKEY